VPPFLSVLARIFLWEVTPTYTERLSLLEILYAGTVLVGVGAEKEGAAKARRRKLKGPKSIVLDQRRVQNGKPLTQARALQESVPMGLLL
jgi:hypothetical protein